MRYVVWGYATTPPALAPSSPSAARIRILLPTAKGIPYIFQLDLDAQKVLKDPQQEARPESAEFAKSYVRAVSVWAKSSPTNRSGSLASRATAEERQSP